MRTVFAPVLFVSLGMLAPADDKKVDADLKAMVGKWDIAKAELGGKDAREHFQEFKFEITAGGKYSVTVGKLEEVGSFTVDPFQSPKSMDIKATNGPNKGHDIKAIYKIDGDSLTVCYAFGGGDRPAKFESQEGTKVFLAVYKRKK